MEKNKTMNLPNRLAKDKFTTTSIPMSLSRMSYLMDIIFKSLSLYLVVSGAREMKGGFA